MPNYGLRLVVEKVDLTNGNKIINREGTVNLFGYGLKWVLNEGLPGF